MMVEKSLKDALETQYLISFEGPVISLNTAVYSYEKFIAQKCLYSIEKTILDSIDPETDTVDSVVDKLAQAVQEKLNSESAMFISLESIVDYLKISGDYTEEDYEFWKKYFSEEEIEQVIKEAQKSILLNKAQYKYLFNHRFNS